jgi:MobC-like protein
MKSRVLRLSIRVSAIEQLEIATLAHKTSMSVSMFCRKKLLGEPINQIVVPESNLETYRAIVDLTKEIRAVGKNLNQMIKWMQLNRAAPKSLLDTVATTQQQIETANEILRKIQLDSIGTRR